MYVDIQCSLIVSYYSITIITAEVQILKTNIPASREITGAAVLRAICFPLTTGSNSIFYLGTTVCQGYNPLSN